MKDTRRKIAFLRRFRVKIGQLKEWMGLKIQKYSIPKIAMLCILGIPTDCPDAIRPSPGASSHK
jgi:hypothetical protein